MKKVWREMIIGLIVLLTIADVACAEGISLTISCTIPAIPGVNAPPFEEETTQTKKDNPAQIIVEPQQENQPTPTMIQQDKPEEKETSEGQKTLAMVKTIYSR